MDPGYQRAVKADYSGFRARWGATGSGFDTDANEQSALEATPEELMEFCRENIPTFKQPKEIRILDTLPKSSIGKILKRELR